MECADSKWVSVGVSYWGTITSELSSYLLQNCFPTSGILHQCLVVMFSSKYLFLYPKFNGCIVTWPRGRFLEVFYGITKCEDRDYGDASRWVHRQQFSDGQKSEGLLLVYWIWQSAQVLRHYSVGYIAGNGQFWSWIWCFWTTNITKFLWRDDREYTDEYDSSFMASSRRTFSHLHLFCPSQFCSGGADIYPF